MGQSRSPRASQCLTTGSQHLLHCLLLLQRRLELQLQCRALANNFLQILCGWTHKPDTAQITHIHPHVAHGRTCDILGTRRNVTQASALTPDRTVRVDGLAPGFGSAADSDDDGTTAAAAPAEVPTTSPTLWSSSEHSDRVASDGTDAPDVDAPDDDDVYREWSQLWFVVSSSPMLALAVDAVVWRRRRWCFSGAAAPVVRLLTTHSHVTTGRACDSASRIVASTSVSSSDVTTITSDMSRSPDAVREGCTHANMST